MNTLRSNSGIWLKAAALIAVAAAGLFGTSRETMAQTSVPTITSLQTGYGTKDGTPALPAVQSYTINGTGFSSVKTDVTVILEKMVFSNGYFTWVPVSQTNPTWSTATKMTANVGNVAPGQYRVKVGVKGTRAFSNTKPLLVVPSTVSLDLVNPNYVKPGYSVLLKGNLFPTVGTNVVLTPPAEIASYMGTRYVTPTAKTAFEITFTVPEGLWGGDWKVGVTGWNGGTNKKDITISDKVSPEYAVFINKITCLDLSADGPGTDEIFLSMVTHDGWGYDFTPWGTGVYEDIATGTVIGRQGDINFVKTGNGYSRIYNPSNAYYIIAIGEADQYSWSITQGWYWDNDTRMQDYGYEQAQMTVFEADQALIQQDPILLGSDQLAKANWLRDKLYAIVGNIGDECLGSKVITFTQDEVYKARALNGKPFVRTYDYTGDYSRYRVEMHLVKIN